MVVGLTSYSPDVASVDLKVATTNDFSLSGETGTGFVTFSLNDSSGEGDVSRENFEANLLGASSPTANAKDGEPVDPEPVEPEPVEPEPVDPEPVDPEPAPTIIKKAYVNAYNAKWGVGDFELYMVGALSYAADMWDRSYNSQNFIVLTN